MKCKLTFITVHCSLLLSSRNVCNISATAGRTTGTNCLELPVEWSVTVPEFHGYLGNDALLAGISSSEAIINHKGPNQEDNEGSENHSRVSAAVAA